MTNLEVTNYLRNRAGRLATDTPSAPQHVAAVLRLDDAVDPRDGVRCAVRPGSAPFLGFGNA